MQACFASSSLVKGYPDIQFQTDEEGSIQRIYGRTGYKRCRQEGAKVPVAARPGTESVVSSWRLQETVTRMWAHRSRKSWSGRGCRNRRVKGSFGEIQCSWPRFYRRVALASDFDLRIQERISSTKSPADEAQTERHFSPATIHHHLRSRNGRWQGVRCHTAGADPVECAGGLPRNYIRAQPEAPGPFPAVRMAVHDHLHGRVFLRVYSTPKPLKYIFSFFGIVDLLSIIPTYLSLAVPGSHYLLVVRILRLLRIARIFKLTILFAPEKQPASDRRRG